jgi:protein-tyrosine phosphatase
MFVDLSGACNFRDAGGQQTASGARVRQGMLYRSNSLSRLTPDDRERLLALRIRRVYDLREPHEGDRAPTVLPGIELISSGGHPEMLEWSEKLAEYPRTPAGMTNFLVNLYASLPFVFARDIAGIVCGMASSRTPCIIHCSAGKDRTGVAAAILLWLLDVPHEAIFAEYRLTAGRFGLEDDQRRAFAGSNPVSMLGALDADSLAAMLSVDDRFLQSAFDAVAHRGSIDDYVRDCMNLDQAAIEGFRGAMLQQR